MMHFIQFFEQITTLQKLSWVFGCLFACWLLESGMPLFTHSYNKWKHDGINLVFFSFSALINLIIGILGAGIFVWVEEIQFGLLNWVTLPVGLEILIAVMALDLFGQYVIHFMLHRVKWMWKMHMVHHSDTQVDATTGTRHHPGDYLTRELMGLLTVLFFGIPVAYWAFYRICSIFFTYWTHANIALPLWMEKCLALVLVTPNMHKFHHHYKRPWTDSNFGNIFSVWDRIFGTFIYENPKAIKFGLDTLDDHFVEDLSYQLGLPFNKDIKTDD